MAKVYIGERIGEARNTLAKWSKAEHAGWRTNSDNQRSGLMILSVDDACSSDTRIAKLAKKYNIENYILLAC